MRELMLTIIFSEASKMSLLLMIRYALIAFKAKNNPNSSHFSRDPFSSTNLKSSAGFFSKSTTNLFFSYRSQMYSSAFNYLVFCGKSVSFPFSSGLLLLTQFLKKE